MKNRLLLILGLCLPLQLQARLTVPTIDLNDHSVSANAMLVVWSGTDVTLTAGSAVVLSLPSDWTVPATNIATCGCAFLKHTITGTAGTFTAVEVTVTAGSISGSNISISLPASAAPGPFYLRLDDFAGLRNPPTAGMATLAVTAGSDIIESRPIAIVNGVESTPGEIKGLVTDAGVPVKGALVFVSTDTVMMDNAPTLTLGPTAGTITAKAVTLDRLIAVTDANGRYSLKVPFNGTTTYNVAALYGTSAAGGNSNYKSTVSTVNVSSSTPATVNLGTFAVCINN